MEVGRVLKEREKSSYTESRKGSWEIFLAFGWESAKMKKKGKEQPV